MSRIAKQSYPATSPMMYWPTIEDIVAQDGLLVGGLDQSPYGFPPAIKELREPRLSFPCMEQNRQAVFERRAGDFWIFWTGQTISQIGSALTNTALPLLVFKLSGSALNLGVASAAIWVPYPLFGLFIGAWDVSELRTQVVSTKLHR